VADDTEAGTPTRPQKVTGRVPLLGVPKEARALHKVDVHGKPLDADPPTSTAPQVGGADGAPAGTTDTAPTVASGLADAPAAGASASELALPGGRTAQVYDPRTPLPLPERLRPLVGDLTAVAPRMGLKLGLACGRAVAVTCEGVGRLPADSLADVGSVWSVTELGLSRQGVLVADDSVLVALADLMLGGTGNVPTRPVHRVEAAVLRRHLTTALTPLVEPLGEHGVTGIALGEPPMDDVVTFLGGAEVIAVRLRIAINGEALAGAMILAIPSRLLLSGDEHEPTGSRSTIAALAEVPLDVTVQFPATTFSAYEMTGLERGDVLRLEASDPLVVGQIEGRPYLTGSLGRSGRRRAIVVQSVTGG
jgi:hypothetical protein